MSRRRAPVIALLVLLGAAVGACDDEAAGAEPNPVRVSAGDSEEFRFDMPAEIPAGATRLSLVNDGEQAHHAQALRLDDGATVADLEDALERGGPPAVLDVGTFVGGTALVSPGETSQADAVLDLQPGSHVLLCFVPDADGVPHVGRGMVQVFEVSAGSGSEPSAPEVDGTIELDDYRFDLPDRVEASSDVEVTNASTAEAHELVVAQLDDGATPEDAADALDALEPLPGVGLGGMQAILPGATARLRLRLDPGRYVVFCAVPSPDGTPHYRAGMIQEVTVT